MKVLSDVSEGRSGLSGEPIAPWAVACRGSTHREGSMVPALQGSKILHRSCPWSCQGGVYVQPRRPCGPRQGPALDPALGLLSQPALEDALPFSPLRLALVFPGESISQSLNGTFLVLIVQ